MRKWTVMLIPHDRGSTQTLNLYTYQIWLLVLVLVGLSFSTAFFYGRHEAVFREMAALRRAKQDLESRYANQTANLNRSALTGQERAEVEGRVRAEYEASVATITAELSALYDMEAQARKLTGLAPRTAKEQSKGLSKGGKGGGSGRLSEIAYEPEEDVGALPGVIYGLSNPSADLVIQEINLRTQSLSDLVASLKARQDEIMRLPSIWPVLTRLRGVSSPFGYRKDPYTLHVQHHDGMDISAPFAAPVVATGNGTVLFAQYDGEMGNLIKIDHGNGTQTWYAHLQTILVKVGDTVKRETVIGKVGTTGRSTGPHLHYEVHVNGKLVNPANYLRD